MSKTFILSMVVTELTSHVSMGWLNSYAARNLVYERSSANCERVSDSVESTQ